MKLLRLVNVRAQPIRNLWGISPLYVSPVNTGFVNTSISRRQGHFCEHELRLTVNEKKSKVAPVAECGFLGFVFVRGWMNYFGISEYYRPIPLIDEWLRLRLRMCYWKQWRYARTPATRFAS